MNGGCREGQFWDGLVRQCLSCERACEQPLRRPTCAEFCVSLRCSAVSGNYYDRLLKRCMRCADLCGSHPAECAYACRAQPTALGPTRPPVESKVLQTLPGWGGSSPGGETHTAVIYSLLGLCLAALVCTLSLALLVLLWKTGGGHRDKTPPQDPEPEEPAHRPSSKDRLMDPVVAGWRQGGGVEKKARPTETCIHCFPELRASRRADKPCTVYQQAAVSSPPAGFSQYRQEPLSSLHTPCDKADLRIICSPTQTST